MLKVTPELRARAPRHRPQPAGRGARTADGPTGETARRPGEPLTYTFNIDLNATRPGNPAQRVSREEPSVETVVWWSPGGTAKKWSHGLFDMF